MMPFGYRDYIATIGTSRDVREQIDRELNATSQERELIGALKRVANALDSQPIPEGVGVRDMETWAQIGVTMHMRAELCISMLQWKLEQQELNMWSGVFERLEDIKKVRHISKLYQRHYDDNRSWTWREDISCKY